MTTKDEKAPAKSASTSGASDAQIAKGERTGKAVGPEDDGSFHVYEFEDANQGESGEKGEKK